MHGREKHPFTIGELPPRFMQRLEQAASQCTCRDSRTLSDTGPVGFNEPREQTIPPCLAERRPQTVQGVEHRLALDGLLSEVIQVAEEAHALAHSRESPRSLARHDQAHRDLLQFARTSQGVEQIVPSRQYRDTFQRNACLAPGGQLLEQDADLVLAVRQRDDPHRLPGRLFSASGIDHEPDVALHAVCVAPDETLRDIDDVRRRSIVRGENRSIRLVFILEASDELGARAVESVDVLIVVSDDKDRGASILFDGDPLCDRTDEVVLVEVDVLVFIDEQVRDPPQKLLVRLVGVDAEDALLSLDDPGGKGDQIVEFHVRLGIAERLGIEGNAECPHGECMVGMDADPGGIVLPDHLAEATADQLRRHTIEGQDEDAPRRNAPDAHQVRDAVHQRSRLARSRPGQHQQVCVGTGCDDRLLVRVLQAGDDTVDHRRIRGSVDVVAQRFSIALQEFPSRQSEVVEDQRHRLADALDPPAREEADDVDLDALLAVVGTQLLHVLVAESAALRGLHQAQPHGLPDHGSPAAHLGNSQLLDRIHRVFDGCILIVDLSTEEQIPVDQRLQLVQRQLDLAPLTLDSALTKPRTPGIEDLGHQGDPSVTHLHQPRQLDTQEDLHLVVTRRALGQGIRAIPPGDSVASDALEHARQD